MPLSAVSGTSLVANGIGLLVVGLADSEGPFV